MSKVVLFGAGSPLIVDYEETCARLSLEIIAIVENQACDCMALNRAVLVPLADLSPDLLQNPVAVPLFSPANRRAAAAHARRLGAADFVTLIDPTAIVPRRLDVSSGVYVSAGVVIGAATTLAEFSLVNRGAILGHHLQLGAFASIGPGAVVAGQVTIGDNALIGAGATILPKIEVGANAVVSAGAVVTADVAPFSLVAGSPARVIRTLTG